MTSIEGIQPGESLDNPKCSCGAEVNDAGELCRSCDLNENGPPDQYWEDRAESADLARERGNQELRDAGRGHLVR
jgi:hypothetical protein